MDNFDYIRHRQGPILIVSGDVHADNTIFALPCYIPDPNGDRIYKTEHYSRFPRIAAQWFRVGESRPSPVDHNIIEVPRKEVAEKAPVNKQVDETRLGEQRTNILRHFKPQLDALEAKWTITGSHQFGLPTESSDLDILIQTDKREDHDRFISELNKSAEGSNLTEILEYIKKREMKRFSLSSRAVDYHLQSKRESLFTTADFPEINCDKEVLISFLSSQIAGTWTDFPLPRSMGCSVPVTNVSAQIVEDDQSHALPRKYKVEIQETTDDFSRGAEIDLLTYHWIYCKSFNQNDLIRISGDYFADNNIIYVRNHSHRLIPERLY